MPDSKKQCHVCGQPAASFNFFGLSCQSCKIFFRRYAHTPQKFTCHASNNCSVIGPHQRSSCQSCRLTKCFTIGMRKELINAKYTKQQKKPQQFLIKDQETETDKNCTENAKPPNKKLYQKVLEKSSDDDFNPQVLPELHHFTNLLLPFEEVLFNELQRAVRSSFVDERLLPLSTSNSNFSSFSTEPSNFSAELLLQVYNNHCCYIVRIIKFCKAISTFCKLPSTDQLALLKEFYIDVLTIRAAFNYIPAEDGFPYLENDAGTAVLICKMPLFRQAKVGGPEAEDGYRKFFISVQALVENDETLRNLLIAYLLFEHRTGLISPELICYQQAIYGHLLLRYLHHCKYPSSWKRAKQKYQSLLDKLSELKVLNNLSYRIITSYNREQVGQVVTEVFDL